MFTATLFTIAETWYQLKCPSVVDWIKKMWYIYTMESYSALKNKGDNVFCRNMDEAGSPHHQQTNTETETKHHVFSFISGS